MNHHPLPNADPGDEPTRAAFGPLAGRRPRAHLFAARGEATYLGVMRLPTFIPGSSSSGTTEGPIVPAVLNTGFNRHGIALERNHREIWANLGPA